MESCSSSIFPVPPTGYGRRVALVTFDLQPSWPINHVFVYPSLDVDRLKRALEHALSLWPIVCGHIELDDASSSHYSIVFSDKAIPFTVVENTHLNRWPTDLPVVVSESSQLRPYLDPVFDELHNGVPLLRLKVTRLTCSKEFVLGISFSHLIGDAGSFALFLDDLSRLYQDLEPRALRPVFDRCLWPNEKPDLALIATMKNYRDGAPIETLVDAYRKEHESSDPLTMIFSSKQLALLRIRAGGDPPIVSTNDALIAYVIYRLNTHFFLEQEPIQRASIAVSYRGISQTVCSPVQVGNCFMHILSDDFSDPYCFSMIAQTLRHSINRARKEPIAISHVATENLALKQLDDQQFKPNWTCFDNEVFVNSQYKYDWAAQFDLGMTHRCRMHMAQAKKLYLRVFRPNPVQEKDGTWSRDVDAAEVSVRLTRGPQMELFVQAWKNDVKEDFLGV